MESPDLLSRFYKADYLLKSILNNIYLKNKQYKAFYDNYEDVFIELFAKLDAISSNLRKADNDIIENLINQYEETYTTIKEYTGEFQEQLPRQIFSEIFPKIRSSYDFINLNWAFFFQPSNEEVLYKEIEKLKEKGETDAKSITDLRNKMELELKEFDERYKKNLGDYELLSQEKIFREAGIDNHYESQRWIWYIVGLTALLLIVSTWFMYSCWLDFTCLFTKKSIGNFYNTDKWQVLFYYELFKPIVIRVFILSVIILLLKFALKNYNALMHNKTVNMHKANSLAAMIRIINSLPDENTRNTLINLAGKEIFLHQKTGYLRKDDNKIDLGIIEKLASILQKKE